jgi:hypothetical protein
MRMPLDCIGAAAHVTARERRDTHHLRFAIDSRAAFF